MEVHVISREEIYLKQRSRVLWLTEGDRNASFFHRSASKHKRRNTITLLEEEGGREYKEQEEMGRLLSVYLPKGEHEWKPNNKKKHA